MILPPLKDTMSLLRPFCAYLLQLLSHKAHKMNRAGCEFYDFLKTIEVTPLECLSVKLQLGVNQVKGWRKSWLVSSGRTVF